MAKRSKDLIKFVVTEKDRLAFTVNTEYNNMLDYLSKRLENLHEEEDIPFEEYKELSKRILKCLATLKLSFNSFDDSIEEMFEEYNLEQYRNKGIAKSSNIKERSSDSKEQSSEPDIDGILLLNALIQRIMHLKTSSQVLQHLTIYLRI